jgi:hypothetical protein
MTETTVRLSIKRHGFHAVDIPMPLKRENDRQGLTDAEVTALFLISKAF